MRYLLVPISVIIIMAGCANAQQKQEPWKSSQLISTKALAEKITNNQAGNTLILSIGPDAPIKGSVDIGPTENAEHVKKLRTYLDKIPRDREVVIYCGCCPFDKCPNIRPAFQTLNEMGFKNARLLDIPKNIRADWLDKNYPTRE